MSQEDKRQRKNSSEQSENKAQLKQRKRRQKKKQTHDQAEQISGRVIEPSKLQMLKKGSKPINQKDLQQVEVNQSSASNREKSKILLTIETELKKSELSQKNKFEKMDFIQKGIQLMKKKRQQAIKQADQQAAQQVAQKLRNKNYSQQVITQIRQQTCPKYKAQNSYYNNLRPQQYLKQIQTFSNYFRRDKDKGEAQYKEMLSEIGRQLGKQILKSGLECEDEPDKKLTLQSWKLLQWAHDFIIKNKQIYFQAFKIQNQFFEKRVRKLFFERAYNNFFRLFSEGQQIQTEKCINEAFQKMFSSPNLYFPHFVKRSHVYQSQKLAQELEELVETVKSSWVIRNIIGYFLYDLKFRCKCYKSFMKLNQQNLKESLLQLKIFFIDSPMEPLCGVTQTADKTQQYPIFINFYKLCKEFSENIQQNKGIYLSYALCAVVHQIGQAIPRKIKLIEDEDDSNLYQVKYKDQKDGGWMLQHLAFGAAMDQILSNDYQKVKTLLQYKVAPIKFGKYTPQALLFNLQEYQIAKKKLKEEQSNQKKIRKYWPLKTQQQNLVNNDIRIQLKSLGLKEQKLNQELIVLYKNYQKHNLKKTKKKPIQIQKQAFYNMGEMAQQEAQLYNQLSQHEKKTLQQTIEKLNILHNLCKKTDKIIEKEKKNNRVSIFKAKQSNRILSYRSQFVRRDDQVQSLIYKTYKQ